MIDKVIQKYIDSYLNGKDTTEENVQMVIDELRKTIDVDDVDIIENDPDNGFIVVSFSSSKVDDYKNMKGVKIPVVEKDGRIIRAHYDKDGLSETMLGNPNIQFPGTMLHYCMMQGNTFYGIIGMHTIEENRVWTAEERKTLIKVGRLLIPYIAKKLHESSIHQTQGEKEKMDLLAEAVPGGFKIWCDDEMGTITYFAEKISTLQGYALPEYFDHCKGSMYLNIHPEDREKIKKQIKKEINENEAYSVQYRVICKNGEFKWVQDIGKRVTDENGHTSLYSIVSDITKSAEQERLLMRERRRYRESLLANSEFSYELDLTDGMVRNEIVMKDGKEMVSFVNESLPIHYDDLCRLSMEAIQVELLDEKTRVYWTRQGLLNAFARGEVNAECEYFSKLAGKYYRNSALMSLDESNGHVYAIMMCTDITDLKIEQKKNEEKLMEAYEEANKANKAKSEFLSSMSHEIRTPMNAIVGLTDVILRRDLPDDVTEYLTNIKSSGAALLNIINDLLDISKIEAGKFEIVENNYDLVQLLKDVELIGHNRVGEKEVELKFNIDSNLPRHLYGDSLRIRQILINLMNNAIKFTDEGSVIVSLKADETKDNKVKVLFDIKDSGIGIKKEDMQKIFDPFSQADIKKNTGKEGTGLGLSISNNLVQLMGGEKISIKSEYGKGSEFYYSIWQDINDDETIVDYKNASGERVNKSLLDFDFRAPDAKILIAEDNNINQLVVGAVLESLLAEIEFAENGEKAVEMIKSKKYDIVFMDHHMPLKNGVEATKEIRQMEDDYYRNIPIIALTADAIQSNKHILSDAGMNDIITKPISIQTMNKTLKKWLPKDKIKKHT